MLQDTGKLHLAADDSAADQRAQQRRLIGQERFIQEKAAPEQQILDQKERQDEKQSISNLREPLPAKNASYWCPPLKPES